MSENNDLLIEVENLKVYFYLHEGTVRAVDGVSFQINQGKTLGIIGESGSGKSVTAQSIMGIVPMPPARLVDGQILLYQSGNGPSAQTVNLTELRPNGPEIRAIRGSEIAMVFQEPMTAFSPVHTIGAQIMEGILLHIPGITKADARKQAIDLLRRVGIPRAEQRVDSYSYQLSGGMRQRAMIAMALGCNPRLLIADEPTTALDVTIQAQILELLRVLQEELGMAIMYISHDLAVVGSVADEIMVMYLGLVMEHASVDEIFDNPLHPYTKALWESIPRVDMEIDELNPVQGTLPSPFAVHPGCPFYPRCGERIAGVCDVEVPPMLEVIPGHKVRCFLFQEPGSNLG